MLKIKLKNANEWDVIILDCPPAHGLIHLNALLFAEHIIFPVTPEVWSYDGLEGVLSSIKRMQKYFNYKPNIIGALPTIVDERYSLTEEVRQLLEAHGAMRECRRVIDGLLDDARKALDDLPPTPERRTTA